MKREDSQPQSLPREVLTRIHKLSGPKSRTASTLVSKDMQESRTKRAMSKGAKLRPKPKDKISAGFADLVKAARELHMGKNKGGLAKKTKGFKQGGLAGTGHNDMRKGGLFR